MLLASLHALVRLAISVAVLRTQSEGERDLEILALRHQVAILRRQWRWHRGGVASYSITPLLGVGCRDAGASSCIARRQPGIAAWSTDDAVSCACNRVVARYRNTIPFHLQEV